MRYLPLAAATFVIAACRSAPPPAPVPLPPLGDSANSALTWVQSRTGPFNQNDSVATTDERAKIFSLTSGARLIGFSELVEGTHEMPYAMRRALLTLADSGVRGLAIQASMADAMFVDRYVRGGPGDPRRLLHALQAPESQRIATRETIALVEALREWNAAHRDKQIGFYGFEIPTARSAITYITALPDSILGAPLKAFLVQKYTCVSMNEGAHWGLEGRTSDSTFWNACAPATAQATDSVVALRQRAPASQASTLEFAEQMARLIQHHTVVGLRHLKRHEGLAEHVMFLLDRLGPTARLVLWGGDVEMTRVTLDKTTVQTAVVLGEKLGAGYRAIGFTVGDGTIRARILGPRAAPGELPGIGDARLLPPSSGSYEDVFIRANANAYWLDLRSPGADIGGAWLKGPRSIRLISETYVPSNQTGMETPVGFPAALDGVVFVKHATPSHPQ